MRILKLNKLKVLLSCLVASITTIPAKVLAQTSAVKVNVPASAKGPEVGAIASSATNILLWVAGIAGVIAIVVGGIMYITSAGDEKRVQSAKNTVLYAVVGMIIAVLAWGIASFVVNSLK